jgi:hypothetical protein
MVGLRFGAVEVSHQGEFWLGQFAELSQARAAGASVLGDIAEGGAGRQILLQDTSGIVVERFEYAKRR